MNQCLRDACRSSNISRCEKFIDCGRGNESNGYETFKDESTWEQWKNNINATACFWDGSFPYGIYKQAVNLTTRESATTRYVYSLFWGFQVSLRINIVCIFPLNRRQFFKYAMLKYIWRCSC